MAATNNGCLVVGWGVFIQVIALGKTGQLVSLLISPLRIWQEISSKWWKHLLTLRLSNVPKIPHLVFLWCNLAKSKRTTTFGNICNMMSIRRLILQRKKSSACVAEDGWNNAGGWRNFRKGGKKCSFLVNTKCVIWSVVPSPPPPPCPRLSVETKPPLSPVNHAHDRWWPCSA